MKTLVIFAALISTTSPRALALSMTKADAIIELGLPTAADAPLSLTVRMVNEAYSRRIRQELPKVMDGSSVAVAASQKIASARMLLIKDLNHPCVEDLFSPPDSMERSDARLKIAWLPQLYPTLFEQPFNPFDAEEMRAALPRLAGRPLETLASFQLLEEDVRSAFENDPNYALAFSYQRQTATALGQYLRWQKVSQPRLVANFENAITAKLFELGSQTKRLNRFLHALSSMNLEPGRIHAALVPMLEDSRVDIRKLAVGVLMHASHEYGLTPHLESSLLASRNADAYEILVSSKRDLSEFTYRKILSQLNVIQDEHLLKAVVRTMLRKTVWREITLSSLQGLRDDSTTALIYRLYAAEELIDNGFDVEKSEKYIMSHLSEAIGDELFLINQWCYSSIRCSPPLRKAVQAARL